MLCRTYTGLSRWYIGLSKPLQIFSWCNSSVRSQVCDVRREISSHWDLLVLSRSGLETRTWSQPRRLSWRRLLRLFDLWLHSFISTKADPVPQQRRLLTASWVTRIKTVMCFPQSRLYVKCERLQSQLEEWRGLPGHPVRSAARPGGSVQSQNQKQQAEPGGGLPHRRERAEDPQTAGSWRWVHQLHCTLNAAWRSEHRSPVFLFRFRLFWDLTVRFDRCRGWG